MTISSEIRKEGPYDGDGVVTSFPFYFKIFKAEDVLVVRADSAGAETTLVLNSDYTVTVAPDQNTSPGGTVVLANALMIGTTLTIASRLLNLQPVDLTNQGGFYPRVINDALDRLTILVQQLAERVSRSLKMAISTPSGVDPQLPAPTPETLIGWNSQGTGFVNVNRSDAALYGFSQAGIGAVRRSVESKLRDTVSVKDFGAVGDGITDDTLAVQAAINYCVSNGDQLYWPDGIYLTTASINNFHDARHTGPGVHQRSGVDWPITPNRTSVRQLYVSPSGSASNDGLTASQPINSIQTAVDIVNRYGPVVGRQQIIGAAGVYSERVSVPIGLALNQNYLEFKFPDDPGVRGDPTAWPAGGAILDGTTFSGSSGAGFTIRSYNNCYIEYLLVRNWYDTSLPATSQVKRGIQVDAFANLFTLGVSSLGNGWANIAINPSGRGVVTGGILDGGRYVIDNTGGRLSLTATALTYTTVKNGLEYGLYAKHESSTVMDFTEFLDCGQTPVVANYGAAIFAYKSNTSVDTRSCVFKRNNIVYNLRGGFVAQNPNALDTFGTGADANDRIWLIKGYGQDDLINYLSLGGRELSRSFGGNTTTSTSTALIFNTHAPIPAMYLMNQDQYIEIEIFGNVVGGTGQIRPSFVDGGGTRYQLANFTVPSENGTNIRIIIQPTTTPGTVSVFFACIGSTSGGVAVGNVLSVAVPFDTETLEFQVWGEVSAGSIAIRKSRIVLWG